MHIVCLFVCLLLRPMYDHAVVCVCKLLLSFLCNLTLCWHGLLRYILLLLGRFLFFFSFVFVCRCHANICAYMKADIFILSVPFFIFFEVSIIGNVYIVPDCVLVILAKRFEYQGFNVQKLESSFCNTVQSTTASWGC